MLSGAVGSWCSYPQQSNESTCCLPYSPLLQSGVLSASHFSSQLFSVDRRQLHLLVMG